MPSPASAQFTLRAAAASHPGLKRDNNEDRYHCDPERGLFVVVDGVGGQAAGETAAEAALSAIRARVERETGSPLERLREAITLANNEVYRLARSRAEWEGMACVLTAAIVRKGVLSIGHVGDSRLYVYDRAGFRKITHDHSPVGQREDQGDLGEAEAMRHPRRNEIFRDVGSEPHEPFDEDFIEAVEIPFGQDAALLICSDGLSDLVPSAELARILETHAADPEAGVGALIEAANQAGGKDNVTAVFVTGPGFARNVSRFPRTRTNGDDNTVTSRSTPVVPPAGSTATGRWSRRLAWTALGLVLGVLAAYALVWTFDEAAQYMTESTRPRGWSRTWRVGPDASADLSSIQAALDAAAQGDRIEVAPGVYRESLVIRGDVTLASVSPRAVVLEPPDGQGEPWTAIRVERGATGRLSGLTVRPSDSRALGIGVQVFESDLEIENVEVTGAGVAGILLEPSSRATVRSSYLHNNGGSGVIVRTDAQPRLLHNVVAGNGQPAAATTPTGAVPQPPTARTGPGRTATPAPGIDVLAGARPQFFGNIIADNAGEQVRGLAPDARAELVRDNIVGGPGGSRRESTPGTTPRTPARGTRGGTTGTNGGGR